MTAQSKFDWSIYVDATCAGLSVLIPIPILDWLSEEFFRRRIPGAVAKRQNVVLLREAKAELNKGQDFNLVQGCLILPFKGLYWLIKRISRKILYFLTIKEAADQLSFYWHKAFLVNYMLSVGHLADQETAFIARQALWQVLDDTQTSPLHQLAQQVIANSKQTLRSLRRFRRKDDDAMLQDQKSTMQANWADMETYLNHLAQSYQAIYQAIAEALAQDEANEGKGTTAKV